MLYQELTGQILKASFTVINELGAGFLESVYEKALLTTLRKQGLEAEAQVPVDVIFQGENVGKFYADILVEGKVIIEVKTVSRLAPEHQAQVINYLNATGIKVGMLINFGNPKLEYRRLSLKTKPDSNDSIEES